MTKLFRETRDEIEYREVEAAILALIKASAERLDHLADGIASIPQGE